MRANEAIECFGVFASSSSMRSARYGGNQSTDMKGL
jgi:hypothetical protein